jgi:hypothetical protein
MKNLRLICFILFAIFMTEESFAQRHHRHRGRKVVVVKHSRYRPRRVTVFRPAWHPQWTCQRRWVYFPRHNFYWDNWRNAYVVHGGSVWVIQKTPPPSAANVNLANEKYYELNEADDDNDEIAVANSEHKEKYKTN